MTEKPIGLADIAAISTAEEGRAVALALFNQLPRWTEITDDPATWPPVNTVVFVDDNGIKLAFIDPASKWRAPMGTYLTKNQKIGWNGSRYMKNQRIYNWRPI